MVICRGDASSMYLSIISDDMILSSTIHIWHEDISWFVMCFTSCIAVSMDINTNTKDKTIFFIV